MKNCLAICAWAFIALCAIGILWPKSKSEKEALAEKDQIENAQPVDSATLRKQQIEKQFSGWDGSHRQLKILVKHNMNDPKSFEHVDTRYLDKGDHLVVQMIYRGNNALGAKVKDEVWAKVDFEGNVIEITSE